MTPTGTAEPRTDDAGERIDLRDRDVVCGVNGVDGEEEGMLEPDLFLCAQQALGTELGWAEDPERIADAFGVGCQMSSGCSSLGKSMPAARSQVRFERLG